MTDQTPTQSSSAGEPPSLPSEAHTNTPSRDELIKKLDKAGAEIIAKHPELASHPSFNSATYISGFDFIADCEKYLDAAGRERFSVAMGRYVGRAGVEKEGTDIFTEVRTECMALLDGRPDLQEKWDRDLGNREIWKQVHDLVKSAELGK